METVEREANAWHTPPPVLSDAVYQDLLERILVGTYKPGELLRQEELAARYSVSRVPVREAMSRLASDGLRLPPAARIRGQGTGRSRDQGGLRSTHHH